MFQIKNNIILNFILLFSIFALISAFFIEYFLGHEPCNLCLIERIPYILSIIIISLIYLLKKYEKIFLIFLSLIFFCAAGISIYHFGIEQGFIEESLVCDLDKKDNMLSKEDLLKKLNEKTVSCKDVTFKVFGDYWIMIPSICIIIISFDSFLFFLYF